MAGEALEPAAGSTSHSARGKSQPYFLVVYLSTRSCWLCGSLVTHNFDGLHTLIMFLQCGRTRVTWYTWYTECARRWQ